MGSVHSSLTIEKGSSVTSDLTKLRVGFIGAGQMATALGKGFVTSQTLSASQIVATDPVATARERFREATGATLLGGNLEVPGQADLLILAMKPQHMIAALKELHHHLEKRHLLVSIAAGVTLEAMTQVVGDSVRLIRVMPNTPALVGAGASAFARGGKATSEDADIVNTLFSTIGVCEEVPESLLDAVTGLSGSGPAFVYQFIEALSDGGVKAGLPRMMATRLAAQTVLGAARMVLSTGQHPGALKDAVTSPGGTTIAGLHALEQGGLRGTVMDAVIAAWERSRELSGV